MGFEIKQQINLAIKASDILVMVVDGQAGPTGKQTKKHLESIFFF